MVQKGQVEDKLAAWLRTNAGPAKRKPYANAQDKKHDAEPPYAKSHEQISLDASWRQV